MISGTIKLIVSALIMVLIALSSTNVLAFNPLDNACKTGNGTSNSATCVSRSNTTDPVAGKNGIISKGATLIATVAGIGAVVMIILGGFNYVTSGGEAQKVAAARSRILSGLIGLVVVVTAWLIMSFVTGNIIR